LASTWIPAWQHTPRHRSMEKESDRPQLAEKPWIPARARDIRPHGHEVRGVAVRVRLCCWAFWSGSSVIHVQGAIS
jgi:hypothetical protein